MARVNHKRFDALMNNSFALGVEDNAAAEFEALRRTIKLGPSQVRRMQHLEKHLDRGDVACDCYENLRRDLI